MSTVKDVRRAETLLRVAETQRRKALTEAVQANNELAASRARVEKALSEVALASASRPGTGGELLARQSRSFLAAAAHSHLSHEAVEAEMRLAASLREVARMAVAVRGRERLLERRRAALQGDLLAKEQRYLDEIAQAKLAPVGEEWT